MTSLKCILWAALLVLSVPAFAEPTLKPFKDNLFGYGSVLEAGDGGASLVIDYDEMRDINGRDEIPERRVRQDYVSLAVRRQQQELVAQTQAGPVAHVAVGKTTAASAIVIYLHGQGGSRKQGVDDFTFGGNFNRLKNLLASAGGLYLSPDFSDFDDRGAAEIAGLIATYRAKSPGAPIVVACGSMGGQLCWRLARDARTAPSIAGFVILGSLWNESFLTSAAFKTKTPVLFAHGSRDRVFPLEKQQALFRGIVAKAPAYPVRFVTFRGGTHGTPIRMVDWRETLNWIFSAR